MNKFEEKLTEFSKNNYPLEKLEEIANLLEKDRNQALSLLGMTQEEIEQWHRDTKRCQLTTRILNNLLG